jgi:hypothetical protein
MNFDSFFNSEAVALPRGGCDDLKDDFGSYLNRIFKDYLFQLDQLDDRAFPDASLFVKNSKEQILNLAASISTAVQLYLGGSPLDAYEEVDRLLRSLDLKSVVTELSVDAPPINLTDPFSVLRASIFHPSFYRIRLERNGFLNPDRRGIFHVPFEKRRLVGNQRYSIPGLPCLYLGDSVWICWEELHRPAFDSVWVSRFRLSEPVSVLDFQFPPHHIWRIFDSLQKGAPNASDRSSEAALKAHFTVDFLKSYIIRWPLIAACSIKCESQDSTFYPEYIIPQMLLQWVIKNKNVDGIRYFSVRTPAQGRHIYAHSNLVFPTRTYSASGHCVYLKRKFSLTEPISWELLEATNFGERIGIVDRSANPFAFVQANRDLVLGYSQTTFAKIEEKLEHIESMQNYSRAVDA